MHDRPIHRPSSINHQPSSINPIIPISHHSWTDDAVRTGVGVERQHFVIISTISWSKKEISIRSIHPSRMRCGKHSFGVHLFALSVVNCDQGPKVCVSSSMIPWSRPDPTLLSVYLWIDRYRYRYGRDSRIRMGRKAKYDTRRSWLLLASYREGILHLLLGSVFGLFLLDK